MQIASGFSNGEKVLINLCVHFRLFVQTTAILVSAMEPVILLLIMMIFKWNIYGTGTLATLLISFMPIVNPICTLLLVTRFRDRAVRLFCFWRLVEIQGDS